MEDAEGHSIIIEYVRVLDDSLSLRIHPVLSCRSVSAPAPWGALVASGVRSRVGVPVSKIFQKVGIPPVGLDFACSPMLYSVS